MPLTFEELVDVSATRERGRVVRMSRKTKVSGITSTTQMSAIAEVLADPSMPADGALILVDGSLLYQVGVEVSIREGNEIADVMIKYEGGQSSASGTDEVRRGGASSLAQISSKTDREGNEVTVTHNAITKRVEVPVFISQAAPWIETIEATTDPDALLQQWIGVVNSDPWRGKDPGRWIVMQVRYEELNASAATPLWRFFWQFQESDNSQGWLPVVAWIDPETNEMPNGLVVGTGIKTVPWYYQRQYSAKFT